MTHSEFRDGSAMGIDTVVGLLLSGVDADRVLTTTAILDAYSHDAWPVSVIDAQLGRHEHRPEIVVMATSPADVTFTLGIARQTGTPVTPRGLGSSVTGQALPTQGGIVLDLTGLTGPPQLNEVDHLVTVPAGVRGSDLESWLAERGFTTNFMPQSLMRSSVGGWIATRATGQLSSKYGGIESAVVSYEVTLSDGLTMTVGQKPRAAVGPDLRQLFLGSEGMFGVVTAVALKVYPVAPAASSEAWILPSVESGVDALRAIYQAGIRPTLMRFYDQAETAHAVPALRTDGCALFLTHDGIAEIASAEHAASSAIVESFGGTSIGADPVRAWYSRRFDFSAVERLLDEPGGFAETIEVAHLWSGIIPLYRNLVAALEPYADEVLGHFSHVYTQGTSLYVIVLGKVATNEEAAERLRDIWRVAMETTTAAGGELSHHHGAGLARQQFIPRNLGAQHQLIRRLKDALDPEGVLNPGHLGL